MVSFAIIDFAVTCKTEPGEGIVVVGDHKSLGSWDEDMALQLEAEETSPSVWTSCRPLLVEVPQGAAEVEVQYKLAKVKKGKEALQAFFEDLDANRLIVVTAKAAGVHCTIAATYEEKEKEPTRVPKFSPPARGSEAKDDEKALATSASNSSVAQSTSRSDIRKKTSSSSFNDAIKKVASGIGLDYMLQAHADCGKPISFWHDIPLFPATEGGKVIPYHVNFVCEIPKTTRKKFEVNTKGEGNPIKQDTKNGKLREYSKGDIWFNYGCLPRTWEDTEFVHPDVGFPGDGDPLDACEIGMRMFATGEVRETKVLGVICMIDEDETDWKLICIDVEDRWAPELNNVEDVDRLLPGALDQIREWWRTYKVTDGKPLNKFGLNEKFMPREYAMEVIVECHEAWKRACAKTSKKASLAKKALSFSKLEDLDLLTDEQALERIAGA